MPHDPRTDLHRSAEFQIPQNRNPRRSGVSCLEAEVGIEPAYAVLPRGAWSGFAMTDRFLIYTVFNLLFQIFLRFVLFELSFSFGGIFFAQITLQVN